MKAYRGMARPLIHFMIFDLFNNCRYDFKFKQSIANSLSESKNKSDSSFMEVLSDVEEMLGQPVHIIFCPFYYIFFNAVIYFSISILNSFSLSLKK